MRLSCFLPYLSAYHRHSHQQTIYPNLDKMENPVIASFRQFIQLSGSDIAEILRFVEVITLAKDEYFLKVGNICDKVALIEKGLLMYHKTSEQGNEVTCDFAAENEWVTHYESLITKTSSFMNIKALETCVLHTISYKHLYHLYDSIPRLERVGRLLAEAAFIEMVHRRDDFQMLNAEERYAKLLKEKPYLFQRIPQYHLASYLGIRKETLSRVRKNMTQGS